MTTFLVVVTAVVFIVVGILYATCRAFRKLALPDWEPDRDGFSDEEEY